MGENGQTATKVTHGNGNGTAQLSPEEVTRLFEREIEVLSDGTIRQATDGDPSDEAVTRTLKTERTYY